MAFSILQRLNRSIKEVINERYNCTGDQANNCTYNQIQLNIGCRRSLCHIRLIMLNNAGACHLLTTLFIIVKLLGLKFLSLGIFVILTSLSNLLRDFIVFTQLLLNLSHLRLSNSQLTILEIDIRIKGSLPCSQALLKGCLVGINLILKLQHLQVFLAITLGKSLFQSKLQIITSLIQSSNFLGSLTFRVLKLRISNVGQKLFIIVQMRLLGRLSISI